MSCGEVQPIAVKVTELSGPMVLFSQMLNRAVDPRNVVRIMGKGPRCPPLNSSWKGTPRSDSDGFGIGGWRTRGGVYVGERRGNRSNLFISNVSRIFLLDHDGHEFPDDITRFFCHPVVPDLRILEVLHSGRGIKEPICHGTPPVGDSSPVVFSRCIVPSAGFCEPSNFWICTSDFTWNASEMFANH